MTDDEVVIDLAGDGDREAVLTLYGHLHPNNGPVPDEMVPPIWDEIICNPRLRLFVARAGDRAIATCILIIVPNLTRLGRPFGLIENVVTAPEFRKRGIGTRILQHALDVAWAENCYKVMLMTGRKDEATLRFYEQAGFDGAAKAAFLAKPNAG